MWKIPTNPDEIGFWSGCSTTHSLHQQVLKNGWTSKTGIKLKLSANVLYLFDISKLHCDLLLLLLLQAAAASCCCKLLLPIFAKQNSIFAWLKPKIITISYLIRGARKTGLKTHSVFGARWSYLDGLSSQLLSSLFLKHIPSHKDCPPVLLPTFWGS